MQANKHNSVSMVPPFKENPVLNGVLFNEKLVVCGAQLKMKKKKEKKVSKIQPSAALIGDRFAPGVPCICCFVSTRDDSSLKDPNSKIRTASSSRTVSTRVLKTCMKA